MELSTARTLWWVGAGGATGVLLRLGLEVALGDRLTMGGVVALVNVSGSLALGFLVARVRAGADPQSSPHRDTLLLLVGTGVLGGYTTYSGLALESVTTARHDGVAVAFVLMAVTLIGGMFACLAGLRLGARPVGQGAGSG